jgi:hypothetical protein
MSEIKLKTIVKKIDNIEHLIWEDRKFFIRMMMKMDKVLYFIDSFTDVDDMQLNGILNTDEQKLMTELTDKLSNIKQFEEDMVKFRKMINSDQVGES